MNNGFFANLWERCSCFNLFFYLFQSTAYKRNLKYGYILLFRYLKGQSEDEIVKYLQMHFSGSQFLFLITFQCHTTAIHNVTRLKNKIFLEHFKVQRSYSHRLTWVYKSRIFAHTTCTDLSPQPAMLKFVSRVFQYLFAIALKVLRMGCLQSSALSS